jgi:hypothetical protein
MSMTGKRSRTGTILAAAVLIAAGFTVAVVEMLRLPKGTIWIVVAVAVAALAVIRAATRY